MPRPRYCVGWNGSVGLLRVEHHIDALALPHGHGEALDHARAAVAKVHHHHGMGARPQLPAAIQAGAVAVGVVRQAQAQAAVGGAAGNHDSGVDRGRAAPGLVLLRVVAHVGGVAVAVRALDVGSASAVAAVAGAVAGVAVVHDRRLRLLEHQVDGAAWDEDANAGQVVVVSAIQRVVDGVRDDLGLHGDGVALVGEDVVGCGHLPVDDLDDVAVRECDPALGLVGQQDLVVLVHRHHRVDEVGLAPLGLDGAGTEGPEVSRHCRELDALPVAELGRVCDAQAAAVHVDVLGAAVGQGDDDRDHGRGGTIGGAEPEEVAIAVDELVALAQLAHRGLVVEVGVELGRAADVGLAVVRRRLRGHLHDDRLGRRDHHGLRHLRDVDLCRRLIDVDRRVDRRVEGDVRHRGAGERLVKRALGAGHLALCRQARVTLAAEAVVEQDDGDDADEQDRAEDGEPADSGRTVVANKGLTGKAGSLLHTFRAPLVLDDRETSYWRKD